MAKHKTNLALVEPSKLAAITANIETLNLAVAKLRAADAEFLKEEVALQQTASPALHDDLTHAALQLLDGPAAPAPKSNASRISEITTERAKIARAMEIANNRMTQLLFDQALEKRKLIADDWTALQRERVRAVVRLQALNRRAQAMLGSVADPHGRSEMPASFPGLSPAKFLLGNGSLSAGEAHDFVELNVRNGTITRAEIEKSKESI
jgi:hypothetical protein